MNLVCYVMVLCLMIDDWRLTIDDFVCFSLLLLFEVFVKAGQNHASFATHTS